MGCPYRYKYELVDFFALRTALPKARFEKKTKRQLYAMFYQLNPTKWSKYHW